MFTTNLCVKLNLSTFTWYTRSFRDPTVVFRHLGYRDTRGAHLLPAVLGRLGSPTLGAMTDRGPGGVHRRVRIERQILVRQRWDSWVTEGPQTGGQTPPKVPPSSSFRSFRNRGVQVPHTSYSESGKMYTD